MSLTIPPEWDVPNCKDSHVTVALISACLEGATDTFKQLHKTSTPSLIPPGPYLLRCAVRSGTLPMLKHILKYYPLRPWVHEPEIDCVAQGHRSIHQQYAIFLAIIQGDCAMLKCLLEAGANLQPSAETRYWDIHSLLELAIHEDQIEVANLLLRRGAKPNSGTGRLSYPLGDCMALAAVRGSHEMLNLLLEYRGKIKNCDIMWNMASFSSSLENAQTLLDLGVNINDIRTTNAGGYHDWGTALHAVAVTTGERGLNRSARFAAWLLQHGIDYTIKNGNGKTALQIAEETGHTQVKTLIEDWIQDHTKKEFSPEHMDSK